MEIIEKLLERLNVSVEDNVPAIMIILGFMALVVGASLYYLLGLLDFGMFLNMV